MGRPLPSDKSKAVPKQLRCQVPLGVGLVGVRGRQERNMGLSDFSQRFQNVIASRSFIFLGILFQWNAGTRPSPHY